VGFFAPESTHAVCDACGALIRRAGSSVERIGDAPRVEDDGSPLRLGATGRRAGTPFTLVGRIRLQGQAGAWNEWWAAFGDGRSGWLGEFQGIYAMTFPAAVPEAIPAAELLKVGDPIALNGEPFRVADIELVRCAGGEGELPLAPDADEAAYAADLHGAGRRFASLDYGEAPPRVFVGERLEFGDLAFENLRPAPGW
jgi:hypothetical protein